MKKFQALLSAYALTFATMLVTLPWAQGQTLTAALAGQICEDILLQTNNDTRNCESISQSYIFDGSSTPIAHFLLCCLGAFGSRSLQHDYSDHINVTLANFILNDVSNGEQAIDVAVYIKSCSDSPLYSSFKLRDRDYLYYLRQNRALSACVEP